MTRTSSASTDDSLAGRDQERVQLAVVHLEQSGPDPAQGRTPQTPARGHRSSRPTQAQQRTYEASTTPGFSIPAGSSACLIARIAAISAGLRDRDR